MSRWTPSRETSGPAPPAGPAILSSSSMKMMPDSSARRTPSRTASSGSISFCASSPVSTRSASGTVMRRRLRRRGRTVPNRSWRLIPISSAPWPENTSIIGDPASSTSISTISWSSSPRSSRSRRVARRSRTSAGVPSTGGGAGAADRPPNNASSGLANVASRRGDGARSSMRRSRAWAAALASTARMRSARTIWTAASARSRTIESTSRPTYPTSVNLVASTLTNGAAASRASRRAISVLPTPVGPIIRMFLGMISSRRSGVMRLRR